MDCRRLEGAIMTSERERWTAADVPDQAGRTAVVTGSSGGLGMETARVLAARGSDVVLACRDLAKAQRAAGLIRAEGGRGSVRIVRLDLASLASVREAADEIRATCSRLDLLINNAAVMQAPQQRTVDGFELTFGTNHLGHFALTGQVLGTLLETPGSRIVTVSSVGHREGEMRFDDLQFTRGYKGSRAYWQSKLANLLFTYELSARLQAAGAETIALAAHPGVVATELYRTSPWFERAVVSNGMRWLNFRLVHSVERGALPTLRAATDPGAKAGQYYGPGGRRGYIGFPVLEEPSPRARSEADRRRLWEISEQLTEVSYRIPAARG
jgi:NAD(P)-dependent dehydrogenase (short-subunit alcohol dehydrogenase family)